MEQGADPETEFWCKILYSIGAHVINVTRTPVINVTRTPETINSASLSSNNDDTISKVFCGYWILMIILDILKEEEKEENEEDNV